MIYKFFFWLFANESTATILTDGVAVIFLIAITLAIAISCVVTMNGIIRYCGMDK